MTNAGEEMSSICHRGCVQIRNGHRCVCFSVRGSDACAPAHTTCMSAGSSVMASGSVITHAWPDPQHAWSDCIVGVQRWRTENGLPSSHCIVLGTRLGCPGASRTRLYVEVQSSCGGFRGSASCEIMTLPMKLRHGDGWDR